MKISENARNAIFLGVLCSVSYFAVYIARNLLSAVTPRMLEGGFGEEYIGNISSLYLVFYAVGQLINGAVGDKIRAKYMMTGGLFLAGITTLVFPMLTEYPYGAMIVYALTGFFLSMIYGPMTKVVAENTEPLHATRCSLGYTFASFFGSPMAGLLATFLAWQSAFTVNAAILCAMALIGFVVFTVMERKKIVQYGQYKAVPGTEGSGVKSLFRHQIVKYSLISILTGVVRTSVVFWLPTYIAQYLGYTATESTAIFTVATLVISATAFIAVFVYERLGYDIDKSVLVFFVSAVILFALTYFVKHPVFNIVFIVLAIMASNSSASMLWSRYCPSLRDTGIVSLVTGFLDFLSYTAAAIANLLFANAATTIGWGNLILIWGALMVVGVIICLPYRRWLARRALNKTE